MVAVANRTGYAGASVSAVTAEAGVSKPTFYDYFDDRDACFEAAVDAVHAEVLAAVRDALEAGEPERSAPRAIGAIVRFAAANRTGARFLMGESMAGGRRALDARDRSVAEIAAAIDLTAAGAGREQRAPDIPSEVVVGAVYRLLSTRLRRGERAISELLAPTVEWVESYAVPTRERKWRSVREARQASRRRAEPGLRPPPALGRGRPQISAEEVEQTQRQRIMFAAATLADEKGYAASTVDDITKLARVDRRAFYNLFSDKQDAFMAVLEFGVLEVIAATAGGFFAGASWPVRIWGAGEALTRFLEANPTIAHVGFVEAYAVGPRAAQRVEDSHAAFAIFLQEGYNHRPPSASAPSRVALEAVIKSIVEIVYVRARAGAKPSLGGTLPYMAFLALAPFIGPNEANAFIGQRAD